jgi:DNA replication and repair protein RecF
LACALVFYLIKEENSATIFFMFLKSLSLVNFRNYSSCKATFKTPITVLFGDNAQGKSNFLESIYYLATTKSSKAEREDELIQEKKDFLRVEGVVKEEEEVLLEVVIQSAEGLGLRKKMKINGIPKRALDYGGNLKVVLFSPEDINLVTGSPSLRRGHMDQVLSQIDKTYRKSLSSYENVLVRKNKILKRIREGYARIDELSFWTDQQIMLGANILIKRRQLFEFLNSVEKNLGDFQFQYLESEVTSEKLKDYQTREIESATSLIGPHRDDFIFKLGSVDLSKFGSRGEQRTAVLDLKLSEVSFIELISNDRPVLLLDDIFSELDSAHRQHVMEISKLQQTIIVTIELDNQLKKSLSDAQFMNVKAGVISELESSARHRILA